MKRRTFVWLSAVSATALSFPSLSCRQNNAALNKTLAQPQFLSHICNAKTIREIGNAYRKHSPGEVSETKLVDLIWNESTEKNVSSANDSPAIHAALEQKIKNDLSSGNTVVVNGWVLSVTEARQCALFSLTQ